MVDADPASCRRGSVSHKGGSRLGGVTEWLMVADCKSAGLTPYVGSNPTPTMGGRPAGVAQLVEHQPSKLRVAGSSPVARF